MKDSCKNCVFLLNINKHPWNRNHKEEEDNLTIGKGAVNEQLAWGCTVGFEETLTNDNPSITYFDFDNGMCEMHTPKDKFKLIVKAEEIDGKH